MQNVVSKLPFTHYPKTVVMLEVIYITAEVDRCSVKEER